MDAIKIISQNVGQTVSRIIENTDERLFENAREIRLFAGRPLRIVNGEEGFFIGRNGNNKTINILHQTYLRSVLRSQTILATSVVVKV